jgi:hypothetical protein
LCRTTGGTVRRYRAAGAPGRSETSMKKEKSERAWIFLYGTFMSARVLRDHGIDCDTTHPARLNGYRLSIRPRVNLTPSPDSQVFGGLALVSHEEISSLYDGLRKDFQVIYNPYGVMAEMLDGTIKPALCFISTHMPDAAPDSTYVNELAECAREMLAPECYINHINGFNQ